MLSAGRILPDNIMELTIRPLANKVMWWRRLHRPDVRLSYTVYGDTPRYQWPVLPNYLPSGSIIYSFGIGRNASFELAMISEFGCRVYAFDPTPRSTEWTISQAFGPRFQFYSIGISDEDGQAAFFPPDNPNDVSYTLLSDTSARNDIFLAEVRTLSSIMAQLDHTRIDMLKMDIEGAEGKVIRYLGGTDIRPSQLLIEFHHGFYGIGRDDVIGLVDAVKSMGYEIFWISDRGLEYGFVRRTLLG